MPGPIAGTHGTKNTTLVTTAGATIPVGHSLAEAAAKCDQHAIAVSPGATTAFVFFDDPQGGQRPIDILSINPSRLS